MRKSFLMFSLLVGIMFPFQVGVLADEGGGHDEGVKNATEKFRKGTSEIVDHEDSDDQHHEEISEENPQTTEHHEDGEQHADLENDHEESGQHDEGVGHGDQPEPEPGPDYVVLGAFGTVNLTFLFVGVWNKWLRRQGE